MAGLDVPRRMYVKDLVHHYQLGISSESPMLQYLSFYHVAEHWFESIYQDDLVDQIQGRLTGPSFSFRRKKDIQDLIKHVNRAIQLRNEELIINEEVALRLTLAKYVDLTQLVADLALYDKDALDYLSCTKVPFSDAASSAPLAGTRSRPVRLWRKKSVPPAPGLAQSSGRER